MRFAPCFDGDDPSRTRTPRATPVTRRGERRVSCETCSPLSRPLFLHAPMMLSPSATLTIPERRGPTWRTSVRLGDRCSQATAATSSSSERRARARRRWNRLPARRGAGCARDVVVRSRYPDVFGITPDPTPRVTRTRLLPSRRPIAFLVLAERPRYERGLRRRWHTTPGL